MFPPWARGLSALRNQQYQMLKYPFRRKNSRFVQNFHSGEATMRVRSAALRTYARLCARLCIYDGLYSAGAVFVKEEHPLLDTRPNALYNKTSA